MGPVRVFTLGTAGLLLVVAAVGLWLWQSWREEAVVVGAGNIDNQAVVVGAGDIGNQAVLVGAGDIGNCDGGKDRETAMLLEAIPGTVFTTGDNAYDEGTAEQFLQCYDRGWGKVKERTRPSPGNHDYETTDAAAYYDYFGTAAGPTRDGYYSYDLAGWYIVVLNSSIDADADSAQVQWLQQDLAAHPAECTLAYWHYPLFSSGYHGANQKVQPLWDMLYRYGADVVINGHDHNYESFGPQAPDGQADWTHGIREFVVGTGGTGLREMGEPQPNSLVRDSSTHGVLRLTLREGDYHWEFVPVTGQSFRDSGEATCVAPRQNPR